MIRAITPEGKEIIADATAPAWATCPRCGGQVALRSRKRMGGALVYFWRHEHNKNLDCPERTRPGKP